MSDNRGNSEREPLATDTAPLTTAPREGAEAMPDSSTGRAPAFQFYPADFLSDPNVIVMSMAERGVYITLLCVCWQQGSVPADTAILARLCGAPLPAFKKMWPAVERCFRAKGEKFVHLRLEHERRKQADYRREKSDAGKVGAQKRWQKDGSAIALPSQSHSTPTILPLAKHSSSSLSSSSSSSSDFRQQEQERARAGAQIEIKPTNGHASKPSEPDEVGMRAGRFCERYGELHAKYRNGAKLVKAPAFRSGLGGGNMEFQEALTLCATWDDARLDLLAQAFLTVEGDDWIDSGPRTLARFRSRATWCDDKLREAGL